MVEGISFIRCVYIDCDAHRGHLDSLTVFESGERMGTICSQRRGFIAALSLIPLLPAQAFAAAAYPGRPITILIGFAPGGVQDISARIFGKYLQKQTGQAVVIENRSGAAGAIAISAEAQARPDGYTLILAPIETLTIMPQIQRVPVDPKVLAPVAMLYSFPAVLVVPASSPVNSVADLVQRAKSKGNLSFGSAAVGSAQHLMGEILREQTGAAMTHVPYRGGSQMTTDLVAGRLDFAFSTYASIQGHLESLKVLAVATPARWSSLPKVPTMQEEGFSGFDLQSDVAAMAPPGTSPELVQQIEALFLNVVKDPDLANELRKQGVEVEAKNSTQLARFLADTRSGTHKLLASIGILLQ
jgi:tripartite-type tricarboxylate transporter receptor subunit TctC